MSGIYENGRRALILDISKKTRAFWLKHYGRPASLIILDLKLLLLWYLFVSGLILIELQGKSRKSYYKR